MDPQPTFTRTPDGRISMDEHGCRTADVAIEYLREMVAKHNLLLDLYEGTVVHGVGDVLLHDIATALGLATPRKHVDPTVTKYLHDTKEGKG